MTTKGKTQCEELKKLFVKLEAVKDLKPELVVVSPLTRAMETASLVFSDSGIHYLSLNTKMIYLLPFKYIN